ncbi:MAG: hypothetical protein PGN08_02180 [Sphingomonas taxi]
MDKRLAAMTELHKALATALELADDMGLTLIAIHLDEAHNLLVAHESPPVH